MARIAGGGPPHPTNQARGPVERPGLLPYTAHVGSSDDKPAWPASVPWVNLDEFPVVPAAIRLVPREFAEANLVFPMTVSGRTLIVCMADAANQFAIDELKFMTGCNVEVTLAREDAIRRAIERAYAPS